MRVYQVECTVTPEGSALELEFVSPTHQSVTQDIPVVNIISYSFIVFKKEKLTRLTVSSVSAKVL